MDADYRYDSLFRYFGELSGVDPLLLKAQVRAESNFNPRAQSPVGAKGLAQFMGATWTQWGEGGDPFNPEASISAQSRYMAWLLKQLRGDTNNALAAYNFGIGNVRRGREWPVETRNYVQRILLFWAGYKNQEQKL